VIYIVVDLGADLKPDFNNRYYIKILKPI